MNQALRPTSIGLTAGTSRGVFAAGICLMIATAALAGWAPLGFSIVTVFLFAGPHNWIEARYFLARLPARWGRLSGFFAVAFTGIFGLTAAFAALPWLAVVLDWSTAEWNLASALWNTGLIAWVVTLLQMRSRQNPRRDWSWTTPIAFLILAAAWLAPSLWSLSLVYVHPLMALWIFDRELARRRVPWRNAYRATVTCLPIVLLILWVRLASAPDLPGEDAISFRITHHAGATLMPGISSHLLVAMHAFLEIIHYAVWVAAIPLIGIATAPWTVSTVPLARRSAGWRTLVLGILVMGAIGVVSLWAAFLIDYPLTRDIYFTIALVHVLAEVPFLLRAL